MIDKSVSEVSKSQERRVSRVIHYNLSYIVQGAEHGNDGAIVLLHDILAGAFAWADVLPQLAATGRAVYAIDLLGYGQSDHPWPADTSNWGHADCLKLLFDQLNLTNIVLVGHGLGGGVAQVLATRLSRERIAALVLIDTIGYERSFAENWPLSEMKKRQEYSAPKETKLEDMMADLRETLPGGSASPTRFRDLMANYIDPWNSELGKELLFQHIRLLLPNYSNSVASDLKVMEKPTLIIWGEEDQQMPLKLAYRFNRDIPGSRLTVIPGAGHLVLFDAPESVASAVMDFLENI